MCRHVERSARSSQQSKTLVPAIRTIGEPRDGRLSSLRQCMVHEGVHRSFPRAAKCARSCASDKRCAWGKCGEQFSNSLADVGVLLPGLVATASPDRTEAHARAEERGRRSGTDSNRWRCIMTSPAAYRAVAASLLFITAVYLTSCSSISHHQFSEPAAGWQTK